MPLTDKALLVRSLAEPDAFEAIFDRHYAAIRGYVARRLSSAAADDVAADVFCIAFDRRERLISERPDCPVNAWLFGIATNLIRRQRRDERRQLRAYARASTEATAVDPTHDVVRRLDARRSAPAVSRALAALSRDERDVLLLVALADLDYEGAAQALEIPIGTVRSRLARARRRAAPHLNTVMNPAATQEEPSCATSI